MIRNERVKVMIAYDGSSYADAAIRDLQFAGLPANAELLVVSVADPLRSSPPVSEFDLVSMASRRVEAVMGRVRAFYERKIAEAERSAAKAVDRLRIDFPEWKIRYKAIPGEPSAELLKIAREWRPDLIVAGSHGHSAISRFFLGSVSKTLAEQADTSVRVVRQDLERIEGAPVKIIIAARDPYDAKRVLERVSRRVWPTDGEIRVIVVDDRDLTSDAIAVYKDATAMLEQAAETLAASGLQISVDMHRGDAENALLAEADGWKADSILVSANAAGGPGLDDTAAGLLTSARAVVEIVR